MTTVLLVEDDPAIAQPLTRALQREGYQVRPAPTGGAAVAAFGENGSEITLVILDLGLPDLDGLEVCRRIRAAGKDLPVLMLTARTDEADFVVGLDAGADDYVAKPFKVKELLARIRTRLRRRVSDEDSGLLPIGDLVINVPEHTVRRGSELIALTPLEFDLLLALARRPRHAFSRELLLEEVWGYRHASDTRLVNVHVQRLRSKIERDPEHPEVVVTVRGVGYRAGNV